MKTSFNLSEVFATAARTVPDRRVLIWRDREFTYAQMNQRVDGVANYLASQGLGCHTERDNLSGHESGQDHVGLYLRNGNEYLEAMIGAYRARTAPFNVSYRYVEAELVYLLEDADARALVYQAEFAPMVAEILGQLPRLEVLIQVADVKRKRTCPRRSRLRVRRDDPITARWAADTVRRRSIHRLHRGDDRHAEGCAVAATRYLRLVDGRATVR